MKDWLGNEYGVGDLVIYAAMSGRCVNMVLGKVVKIFEAPKYGYAEYDRPLKDDEKETHVQIQPIKSSRWQQHYGRTRYIDSRNGKGIDPFCSSRKHMDGGYYENDETAERVYPGEAEHIFEFRQKVEKVRAKYAAYYRFDYGSRYAPDGWHWVKEEFKPYVKEVKEEPKPVTISVIENIVKWNDDPPGSHDPIESWRPDDAELPLLLSDVRRAFRILHVNSGSQ